jgi:K+-sensing histidine kinase KdpD
VITQGQHAGKFTQTLSGSDGYYIPLVGKNGTLGLIGINSKTVTRIEAEQLITLANLSHQLSSALERELPLLSPLL